MTTTTVAPLTERAAILAALDAWIRQRPGLDYGNYASGWNDAEGRRAYFRELRSITRDLHDARALLAAVGWRDSITADNLKHAFCACSGRLTWTPSVNDAGGTLDYCTGQYWPTEYRAAVCAVLARALWDYFRDNATPDGTDTDGNKTFKGKSWGEYIRATARRALGRGLAARWFN